jgi:uncharacterized protein YeaO (DUF488 family)
MSPDVTVRRVYDDLPDRQETRVLVDRVWPRGVRKDALRLDEWARDVAPSTGLRKWFGHDQGKFAEFRRRYLAELAQPGPQAALGQLRTLAAAGPVALLTATHDVSHSQAAVLGEILSQDSQHAGQSTGDQSTGDQSTGDQSTGELARTSKADGPEGG